MVCGARVITRLRSQDAWPYCVLPAWLALMMQVPTASKIAVLPEAVQSEGVVDAKLIGRPEEAVAFRLTDPVSSAAAGITAKAMV